MSKYKYDWGYHFPFFGCSGIDAKLASFKYDILEKNKEKIKEILRCPYDLDFNINYDKKFGRLIIIEITSIDKNISDRLIYKYEVHINNKISISKCNINNTFTLLYAVDDYLYYPLSTEYKIGLPDEYKINLDNLILEDIIEFLKNNICDKDGFENFIINLDDGKIEFFKDKIHYSSSNSFENCSTYFKLYNNAKNVSVYFEKFSGNPFYYLVFKIFSGTISHHVIPVDIIGTYRIRLSDSENLINMIRNYIIDNTEWLLLSENNLKEEYIAEE